MKIVKIMFRKNYTKWKPLGTMDFQGKEYVTMIRKNKKNGMLQFKTIRINGFFWCYGVCSRLSSTNFNRHAKGLG